MFSYKHAKIKLQPQHKHVTIISNNKDIEVKHMIDYTEIQNRFNEKKIASYTAKIKVNGKSVIAQSTLDKIKNNNGESLSTTTIEDICQLLQCQPSDILKDWHVELDPAKSIDAIRDAEQAKKDAAKKKRAANIKK